jgi:magnesium-transporting ATPase (P-type)
VSDGEEAVDLDVAAEGRTSGCCSPPGGRPRSTRPSSGSPTPPTTPSPSAPATPGCSREDGGDFEILDDLPFEPGRAYHAVLADTDEGRWLSVKGAPRRSSTAATTG